MKSSFRFKMYAFILFLVHIAVADIYLHNPRGGNNRLDEEQRNVRNNKRLFNSQNNNRGGNNVGSLYYYAGSTLQIEWTNQHSCAGPNNNCELVIQYMCGDLVRDGATTDTIPVENEDCRNFDCNTDFEYGMNEDEKYYKTCARRIRNKGLFTATSFLGRRRAKNVHAKFTRQNPNGNRYGFECQEERDYYPYWHSSPWKDIAVMTNDVSRCAYYKSESQNVKSRWECVVPDEVLKNFYNEIDIPNNEADCLAFNHEGHTAQWTEIPAHGIPAPDCRETEYSRDNHNGNGLGGQPNVYNWTIPDNINHEQCVLRMRYNISTNDYDTWNTDSASNPNKIADFHSKYGFATRRDGIRRGFFLRGNPSVQIFPDLKVRHRLAINLAQYGRTFQDRSFAFAVRSAPTEAAGKTIHNLNVRGKRGNLVQTYPSVEYDFVPNKIEAGVGDYIHIQWTGSNTNNPNNAGNGQARTDRNNIILLGPQVYKEGSGVVQFGQSPKYGHYGVNYPMHLDRNVFLGFSRKDGVNLAFNGPGSFGGELSQLDDSGPYYDLDLREVSSVGTYHYMCTRNNDFTNRDQKGRITVTPYPVIYGAIGAMGGEVTFPDNTAIVRVQEGVFDKLQKLRLVRMSKTEGRQLITSKGGSLNFGSGYASDFYILGPEKTLAENGKKITVIIALDQGATSVSVYGSNTDDLSNWTNLNAVVASGFATFEVDGGGIVVARTGTATTIQ